MRHGAALPALLALTTLALRAPAAAFVLGGGSAGSDCRVAFGGVDPTDGESGEVVCVRGTVDLDSRGGTPADGRKVKATIHWVSAAHAVDAEVRLYDRLFTVEDPSGDDWRDAMNPDSLERLAGCKLEPSLAAAAPASRWQFERMGYFCVDPVDSAPGTPVFNRTVTLRDTWAKIEQRG